jgi:outer membrane protein OmpA-like peptidoglycan-associated protein
MEGAAMTKRADLAAAVLAAMVLCTGATCEARPLTEAAAKGPAPAACDTRQFTVYFGSWETALNEDARSGLAVLQRDLSGCQIQRVEIVGMAGAPGTAQANIEVSQQRADAVAAALASGGWPRGKFELSARGAEGATLSDGSEAPMRRRAEITVQTSAR